MTAAVLNVNDAPTGAVTIDDTTPTEDQVLTASHNLADADGLGPIAYTWERADDAAFTTNVATVGTGSTFTPGDAQVGKYLRVTANYTDGQSTAESVRSAVTSAVVNVNDAPTGGVTIDDTTPTEDQVLTVSNTVADADGLGAISYTWQRADDAAFTTNVVTVGTGSTFTPGDAQVGKYLRVTAGYTDGQGTAESVSSAVTSAVLNVNDAPTGGVAIDDTTPTEDQVLTASHNLADADGLGPIAYTWEQADDAAFTANIATVGTGSTFTPGDAQVGKYLRVTAGYTDGHGTAESIRSAVTSAVLNVNDVPTGGVTIDDTTPTEDQLLTASHNLADADGLGPLTYTWKQADDAAFTTNVVTLGTGSTFTPGDAQAGKYLQVTASYTDGQGTAESVSSAVTSAVLNVNDVPTGAVTIDDTTPTEDQVLTASHNLADADGLGPISYTWERADDAAFTTNVATVGTGSTFTPGDAEVGKYLRVTAGYTDGHGTVESVRSAVTSAVLNVNDAPTGAVTIDDTTPTEDQVLTASHNLADADGLGPIAYTWEQADDAAFTANVATVGTGSTFTPGDDQVGKYLRVTASYTDGRGTAESVGSAVTSAVINLNDLPTVSDIADQPIAEDGTAGPLAFTVGDVETAEADLVVTGSSSNTALVPHANIVFGGTGRTGR